jgi:hypothetical protein
MSDFFGMAHVISQYTSFEYPTIAVGYNSRAFSNNRDSRLMKLVLSSDEFKLAVLSKHKRIQSKIADILRVKCDLVTRKVKEYLFMECPFYLNYLN